MKNACRTLICVLLFSCFLPAIAQETPPDILNKPITLDQALEIAFKYNPGLKLAINKVQKSKNAVDESRARFNPTFTANANYIRQGPSVKVNLPNVGSVNLIPEDNLQLQGTFFLPLDISHRLSYASDIAKYQFQIDYLSLLSTAENLILNVKTAYYNVLRAQGQADVAQSAVDVARERLRIAEAKFKAGAAPKFDVMTAETELANLNQRLIAANNSVQLAITSLNRVLGIDVNNPTQVVPIEVTVEETDVDIQKLVAEAEKRRPDINIANTALLLSKKNVKLQRTGILPSLGLTGNYNYSMETSGFNAKNSNWNTIISLSVPIWDGGITKAKVEQAKEDVDIAENQLEQTKLAVATDTRLAALNLQEAAKRVAATEKNVELAKEALRLANVRYEAGIGTQVEISDAERQLTQARVEYVQSRFDYAIALAQLQRAISSQPEINKVRLLDAQPAPEVKSRPVDGRIGIE